MDRWGAGGVRVAEADVAQSSEGKGLAVTIRFDARSEGTGYLSVGLIDEGGHEIGASISPEIQLRPDAGEVRWEIEQLPVRPGIYFPVVCILSSAGQVLDRWKLERAVVIDLNGHPGFASELGPTEFHGAWASR